ncbi:MAG: hypothetical protein ACOZF0_13230 [Thermodesulfobacteriota bacterium]
MRFRIKPGIDISKETRENGSNSLWQAFAATAVLFLLILIFFPVRYETNDDFALVYELSGPSATPVSFVLNPITSHFLFYAYRLFPGIPWYGTWLYGSIFLAIFLIISILIRISHRLVLLWIGPFFLILLFRTIAFPGITSATLLLLFAVFLNILDWGLTGRCPFPRKRMHQALLMIGLFMGFLLRWELATYALVFLVPVLICCKPSRQLYCRSVLSGVLLILLLYPVFLTYLNSGNRQPYNEYSKLRKIFHDTEKGYYYEDITPAALGKAGWSYNDFVLFRNWWFLYDHLHFNKEKLTAFLQENTPLQKKPFLRHAIERVTEAFGNSKQPTILFLLSAMLLFLFRILYPPGAMKQDFLKRSISISMTTAGVLFFAYYRFEPRIYFPLYAYLLGMMAILLYHDCPGMPARISVFHKMIWCAVIPFSIGTIGLVYIIGDIQLQDLSASYRNKQFIRHQFEKVDPNLINKDSALLIVLNPLDNIMIETIHPLKEKKDYPDFTILPFGWQINSPQYVRLLEEFGVFDKDSFLRWTLDNRNVFWFQLFRDSIDDHRISLIEKYIGRYAANGKPCVFQPVVDCRNQDGIGFVFFNLVCNNIKQSLLNYMDTGIEAVLPCEDNRYDR